VQIHPELEEVVQTSGGSKVDALRKVVVPLIAPAIMYAFLVSFIFSYREVTTAVFMISPRNMVLSTVIWNTWWAAGNTMEAAALSVMMTVVMGTFVLIVMKFFPQIRKGMQR